jgi:hypothetical protein
VWRRPERTSRQELSGGEPPGALPATRACRPSFDVPLYDGTLENQIGSKHLGTRSQKVTEESARQRVGRACHDAKPPGGQPQLHCIAFDDCDRRGAEPLPKKLSPTRMQFDGGDPGAGRHQMCGQGAATRSYVEDELTGADACISDDASRPLVNEGMPAPPPPYRGGHGEPSRMRSPSRG